MVKKISNILLFVIVAWLVYEVAGDKINTLIIGNENEVVINTGDIYIIEPTEIPPTRPETYLYTGIVCPDGRGGINLLKEPNSFRSETVDTVSKESELFIVEDNNWNWFYVWSVEAQVYGWIQKSKVQTGKIEGDSCE